MLFFIIQIRIVKIKLNSYKSKCVQNVVSYTGASSLINIVHDTN